jgi:hypothetical protein
MHFHKVIALQHDFHAFKKFYRNQYMVISLMSNFIKADGSSASPSAIASAGSKRATLALCGSHCVLRLFSLCLRRSKFFRRASPMPSRRKPTCCKKAVAHWPSRQSVAALPWLYTSNILGIPN